MKIVARFWQKIGKLEIIENEEGFDQNSNFGQSPIFYIGSSTRSTHDATDNTPRTYPFENPKHDFGVT